MEPLYARTAGAAVLETMGCSMCHTTIQMWARTCLLYTSYDQCLDEYVYSKIWSELSELDKKISLEISVRGEEKVKEIREKLDMNSGLFSVYRDRLKRKGVIDLSLIHI